jgi:photosystem II stability/assembly factor-like uncharacterized protein
MKIRKVIFFAVLLLLNWAHSFAQFDVEWEYVNSLLTDYTNQFSKVYTQGTDNVYVVGEKGFIAKSTDRALTWNKQYFSTRETLNDIIFCTDEIGFIVGNNGTILKTGDSGIQWTQITTGTTQHIHAIATTGLDIWAVGDGGLILYSNDSGETWTIRNLLSDNRNLYDIKFRGNLGYITGQGGNILKTENQGATWEEQVALENLNDYYSIHSLNITENKVYAIAKYDYNGLIISTENNLSWATINPNLDIINYSRGIYFLNNDHGFSSHFAYFTGAHGRLLIFKTNDSGDTWTESPLQDYRGEVSFGKGNFSFFENGEFGYYLDGQILMRTPYTGELAVDPRGLDKITSEQPQLLIKQHENELQISSPSKTISNIEIVSMDGVKLYHAKEPSINTSTFPKGIYLLKVTFTDKTNAVAKWIKHEKL